MLFNQSITQPKRIIYVLSLLFISAAVSN